MHYFEHHIGDYAAATAHLSLLEDAVYSRLLRRYYMQEEPLPADEAKVARLAGARTADEVAAVHAVLDEFFTLQADGWHNKRADEEIERYRIKIEAARDNGRKGGRPPKAPAKPEITQPFQEITQPFNSGSENKTQPKAHQAPYTSNTEPNGSGAEAPPDPPADPIWGTGLAFLRRKGIPEKPARGLLGKLRKACGDVETGSLLLQAEVEDIADPAAWLMAAASTRRARAGPAGQQSKTLTAIQKLQAMKTDERQVDPQRNLGRLESAALPGP